MIKILDSYIRLITAIYWRKTWIYSTSFFFTQRQNLLCYKRSSQNGEHFRKQQLQLKLTTPLCRVEWTKDDHKISSSLKTNLTAVGLIDCLQKYIPWQLLLAQLQLYSYLKCRHMFLWFIVTCKIRPLFFILRRVKITVNKWLGNTKMQ